VDIGQAPRGRTRWAREDDIDAGARMVYPGAADLFLPHVLTYDVTAGANFTTDR